MTQEGKLTITVLEDGRIKIEADDIPDAVHTSADHFVKEMEKLLGGSTDVKHKHAHGHVHTHSHI